MSGVELVTKRRITVGSSNGQRTSTENVPSIPLEIVFNIIPLEIVFIILVRLPADVICGVAIYVCREWRDIIRSADFVSSHREKWSSSCLFFQCDNCRRTESGYVLRTTGSGIEVKKLKFKLPGSVQGTCNGLLHFVDKQSCASYVVNPVTRHRSSLPPFPIPNGDPWVWDYCLVYAPISRVYKMVYVRGLGLNEFVVFTLGVDNAWRCIHAIQFRPGSGYGFLSRLFFVGGFVYWVDIDLPYVLRWDVESESFLQIPLPQCLVDCDLKPLAMKDSLSLMNRRAGLWEFWLLTDNSIVGQWVKLLEFNPELILEDNAYLDCTPVGWLRNGELLVFQRFHKKEAIVYDVKMGQIIGSYKLSDCRDFQFLTSHVHVDSLARLSNVLS